MRTTILRRAPFSLFIAIGTLLVLTPIFLLGCRPDDEAGGTPPVVLAETEPSLTPTSGRPAATDTPAPASTATPTNEPTTTATPTATTSATFPATATVTPAPTATTEPTAEPTVTTPATPQPYLARYRMVSFYGSAEGAPMGILNFREEPQLLEELRARADEYQALSPEHQVIPTFHVIVTVADPWFGEDDNFNHHLSLEAIERWLALAEREGIAVVLDIQPGHAAVQEEFERIKQYLYRPHVHLALDSEYTMEMTFDGLYEIPGQVLGSLYAGQINPVQAQLNEIAREIGVNKVLILHQFEDEMLPDKGNIEDYEHVEVVIDSDGWGGPDKVRDYHQYASEPAFEYGGFKLYRNWDNPVLTAEEVMALEPPPGVVIYQ